MTQELNPQWTRHLEQIGDELLRLVIACDVRLKDPGVVDRILKGDQTVCGRKNEIGFEKLRKLLIATFDSIGKAADRIGPDETKKITDAIAQDLEQRRNRGGNP